MMEVVVVCECGKFKEVTTMDQLSKKWPICDCGQFVKVTNNVVFHETFRDRMGDADRDTGLERGKRILHRS